MDTILVKYALNAIKIKVFSKCQIICDGMPNSMSYHLEYCV